MGDLLPRSRWTTTNKPILVPLPVVHTVGGLEGGYILVEDFDFDLGLERIYTIPAGYLYDGASIPRVVWSILGVGKYDPRVMEAALVHDLLCDIRLPQVGYKMAARAFRERLVGIPEWKKALMYKAVITFGPKWGER